MNNKKIKRIGDQVEICVLPHGFMCTQLKLRKNLGDTASVRDQSGSLPCFAYLKHHQ